MNAAEWRTAQAFMAGAEAVHRSWLENPSDCPRGDPEFLEAAIDYVASIDCADTETVLRLRDALRCESNDHGDDAEIAATKLIDGSLNEFERMRARHSLDRAIAAMARIRLTLRETE